VLLGVGAEIDPSRWLSVDEVFVTDFCETVVAYLRRHALSEKSRRKLSPYKCSSDLRLKSHRNSRFFANRLLGRE